MGRAANRLLEIQTARSAEEGTVAVFPDLRAERDARGGSAGAPAESCAAHVPGVMADRSGSFVLLKVTADIHTTRR